MNKIIKNILKIFIVVLEILHSSYKATVAAMIYIIFAILIKTYGVGSSLLIRRVFFVVVLGYIFYESYKYLVKGGFIKGVEGM